MRQKGMVLLAMVCGLTCALAVFGYTRVVQSDAAHARAEALERYGGDQVEVCVASRDIAPGESISTANTTTRLWLVDLLPSEPVTSLSDIAGLQVANEVFANEVISQKHFEEDSASVMVPQGLQAVSVELGDAQAVAGLVRAGSIVDVYAAGSSTDLLVEKVLVTAVEQGATGSKRVTLAVAPERVQEIIAATNTTTLYLALPSQQGKQNHADAQEGAGAPNDAEAQEGDQQGASAQADASGQAPSQEEGSMEGEESQEAIGAQDASAPEAAEDV